MRPPRALFCDFPLGRPLGRPNDAAFQHHVLAALFALLTRPRGPVVETFPVALDDAVDQPFVCPVPPRVDANVPPAVGEARGLRQAFDRGARRGVRARAGPETVEQCLRAFELVRTGVHWEEAGFPLPPRRAGLAVQGYYEQAAAGLAHNVPGARSAETWFVYHTLAGEAIRGARDSMRASGVPDEMWFGLISQHQRESDPGQLH
jgi:hypothetical protein